MLLLTAIKEQGCGCGLARMAGSLTWRSTGKKPVFVFEVV